MNDLDELKVIDTIRERMHCGYDYAKKALDESDGNLAGALAWIERERRDSDVDLLELATELFTEIDTLAREGAIKKMKIKFNDRIVKEIPIYATAGLAIVLSIAAIVLSQTSIEVEREQREKMEATEEKEEKENIVDKV